MGTSLFVKDKEFRLCNYIELNMVMNEIAKIGKFPSLLKHSFVEGQFSFEEDKDFLSGNVTKLKEECDRLLEMKLSERAHYVIELISEACAYAIENNSIIEIG